MLVLRYHNRPITGSPCWYTNARGTRTLLWSGRCLSLERHIQVYPSLSSLSNHCGVEFQSHFQFGSSKFLLYSVPRTNEANCITLGVILYCRVTFSLPVSPLSTENFFFFLQNLVSESFVPNLATLSPRKLLVLILRARARPTESQSIVFKSNPAGGLFYNNLL